MSVAIHSEHRNKPNSLAITPFMQFAASLEQIPYNPDWRYTSGYWDNMFKDESVNSLPQGIYAFYADGNDDRTGLYFKASDGTAFVIAQRYSHYAASKEILVPTTHDYSFDYHIAERFVQLPLEQIHCMLTKGREALQACFDSLSS